MKILISGITGFLGGQLAEELLRCHEVIGVGRTINSPYFDITKDVPLIKEEFDIYIHAAGLAHIEPKNDLSNKFWDVNVLGTINVLKGLSDFKPKLFVFISSVSVYGSDKGELIDESHPLDGISSYAISKIEAEKIVQEWCELHNVNYLILRLPLLSGKNPPGNLKSMIKAIRSNYYFRIGNGLNRRSMVSVKDIAKLIQTDISVSGIYNLSDGIHPSFKMIDEHIANKLGKNIRSIPFWFISIIAKIGDVLPFFPFSSTRLNKMVNTLTFSDAKARRDLSWNPSPALESLQIEEVKKSNS